MNKFPQQKYIFFVDWVEVGERCWQPVASGFRRPTSRNSCSGKMCSENAYIIYKL